MAKICTRFENPNGRRADRVPARLGGMSCTFDDRTLATGSPKCEGIGIQIKTDDERTMWVYLTHEEIERLVAFRDELDAKYGRL